MISIPSISRIGARGTIGLCGLRVERNGDGLNLHRREPAIAFYRSIEQCIGVTRGRPMLLNKSFTPLVRGAKSVLF